MSITDVDQTVTLFQVLMEVASAMNISTAFFATCDPARLLDRCRHSVDPVRAPELLDASRWELHLQIRMHGHIYVYYARAITKALSELTGQPPRVFALPTDGIDDDAESKGHP